MQAESLEMVINHRLKPHNKMANIGQPQKPTLFYKMISPNKLKAA